jgi:hypothetical protein
VQEIRTLFPDEWGVPHPAGLSYALDVDQLYLLEKNNSDLVPAAETPVTIITAYEDWVSTVSLDFQVENRINVTYDDDGDRLLLLNNELAELAYIQAGTDGVLNPTTLTRVDIADLGLENVEGMDVDFESRRLLLLDNAAFHVVSVDLDAEFDLVSRVDISHLGATDLQGIAVHPSSRNLFTVSPTQQILFELTQSGQLVNSYDLESLNLVDPQGLDFGRSADLTDPADTMHLFIADSRLPDIQSEAAKIYLPLLARSHGRSTAASRPTRLAAQAKAVPVPGRILEVALHAGGDVATPTPRQTDTPEPTPTSTPESETIRLAMIGDFGKDNADEARVAALVNGWNPDHVITSGDNNYPDGEATTIDDNIGQYYSQYIGNYQGAYGPGSPTNRFWPSLGNHDWHTITCTEEGCTGAHFDYFTLPGNERYYDIDLGLVHLFALDSDGQEPDGRDQDSIQANWLRNQLAASDSCYDLVFFHHPPYSSGRHGSKEVMRWPFTSWGADAILNGHDHLYERIDVGGTPFIVNGAGGATLYDFDNLGKLPPEASSVVRYNQDHGALLITATSADITYQFYNAEGILIDDYSVSKDCAGVTPLLSVARSQH